MIFPTITNVLKLRNFGPSRLSTSFSFSNRFVLDSHIFFVFYWCKILPSMFKTKSDSTSLFKLSNATYMRRQGYKEYTTSINSLVLEIIQNSFIGNFRGQVRNYDPNFSLTTSFHVASSRTINFMAM